MNKKASDYYKVLYDSAKSGDISFEFFSNTLHNLIEEVQSEGYYGTYHWILEDDPMYLPQRGVEYVEALKEIIEEDFNQVVSGVNVFEKIMKDIT